MNPKNVTKKSFKLLAKPPSRITITTSGNVALDVLADQVVSRFLATQTLGGTEVRPQIPAAYLRNTATIRGISADYTDEGLEKYLQDRGVIRVRRRFRRQ